MIRKLSSSLLLSIALLITLAGQGQAHMLGLQPPQIMSEPGNPGTSQVEVEPLAIGGPDEFGYTWDNSIPYSWIDASTGTDSGLSAAVEQVGPIALPFVFKYYENTYSQFYISINGLIGFSTLPSYHRWGEIPSPKEPNNVIAPFWLSMIPPVNGWVKYLAGGTEPNRFLVVQWHNVQYRWDPNLVFEFELILHENGNIVFQFGNMGQNSNCTTSGIEDSTGLDGLFFKKYCSGDPNANSAVKFTRPGMAARLSMNPLFDGAFMSPNGTKDFTLVLRNTGDMGADHYDLSTISTWALNFYAEDGVTLLTDTDGDTFIDTGSIAQGGQKTILARLKAPALAVVGDSNNGQVTARSSLNPLVSKTARLQATIPAPFVQVYMNGYDAPIVMDIIRPSGQIRVTSPQDFSFTPAVSGGPGSNLVYTGLLQSYNGNVGVSEIYHSLVARNGDIVRPLGRLTDNQSAIVETYEQDQALTIAPNGNIGVLWSRFLYNGQYNFNVFFAILNPAGEMIFGPQNMTNNSTWGDWYGLSNPMMSSTQITALEDNRFVLAWGVTLNETAGHTNDIYYAVRGSAGEGIVAPTKLTDSTVNGPNYFSPRLTILVSNHLLISWAQENQGVSNIQFTVLDNNGGLIKPVTDLTAASNKQDGYNGDVVQLPNGRILAAWLAWECTPGESGSRVRFAILDDAYNLVGIPTCLAKAPDSAGEINISVTYAGVDKGVITWQDHDHKYAYYSLVDGNGAVIVQPTIFLNLKMTLEDIDIGINGYGNTAYPATFADVSLTYWAQDWIERLYASGITKGCNTNPLRYCPEQPVTRAEMAVFLERGMNGSSYTPPAGTGTLFADVPSSNWAVDWIEKLYADGITTGCILSPLQYCPAQAVKRSEMAVFLLRAKHGAGYTPPPATGDFSDVPTSHWAAAWIEQLFAEGITTGCNPALMLYCPEDSVTRAQMAAFLVRTFALP